MEPRQTDTPPETSGGQLRRIVRDFLFMSASRYVGVLTGIVRSLLIPRFLHPGFYGILKSYQTFSELSRVASLGIPSALFRELPISIARNDRKRTLALENNAFWATVFSAFPTAAAFLLGGAAGWIRFEDVEISWWFLLFIPLLFVDRSKIFFDLVLTGQKNFVLWSKIRFADELLTTAICVTGTYFFGFIGLLTTTLVVNSVILAAFWAGSGYRMRRSINMPVVKEMVSVGFPTLINGLGNTIYNQLNRMVVLAFFGVTYVGFFSVGMTIANQLIGAARMLGRVLMPRMMESFGTSGDMEDLRRYAILPARLSAIFIGPVVAVGIILTEMVFLVILPKYEIGMLPAKILLCGVFFHVIWLPVSQFFLALKKQWRLTIIFFTTIPVALGFNLGAVALDLDLPGVAMATMLSDFGFVSVVLLVALQEFHASAWQRLTKVVNIYSPLLVVALVMLLAHLARGWVGLAGRPLWGPIFEAAVFCVIYGTPLAILLLKPAGRRYLGINELAG